MKVTIEGQEIEIRPDTVDKLRHLADTWRQMAARSDSISAREQMNDRAGQIEAALRKIDQPSLFSE